MIRSVWPWRQLCIATKHVFVGAWRVRSNITSTVSAKNEKAQSICGLFIYVFPVRQGKGRKGKGRKEGKGRKGREGKGGSP